MSYSAGTEWDDSETTSGRVEAGGFHATLTVSAGLSVIYTASLTTLPDGTPGRQHTLDFTSSTGGSYDISGGCGYFEETGTLVSFGGSQLDQMTGPAGDDAADQTGGEDDDPPPRDPLEGCFDPPGDDGSDDSPDGPGDEEDLDETGPTDGDGEEDHEQAGEDTALQPAPAPRPNIRYSTVTMGGNGTRISASAHRPAFN